MFIYSCGIAPNRKNYFFIKNNHKDPKGSIGNICVEFEAEKMSEFESFSLREGSCPK